MPKATYPLTTDTPKGRAAVLADATLCCEREDMIHPVLGCRDTRYLLERVAELEYRERELIATLEALDGERRALLEDSE